MTCVVPIVARQEDPTWKEDLMMYLLDSYSVPMR